MLNQQRCSLTRPKLTYPAMQPNLRKRGGGGHGFRLEMLKFLQERLQDLLPRIKNVCMRLFITALFIKMLWNILEEEWIDILKWDQGSSLQCRILYCSVLHNLSEMKKK